MPKSEEAFFLQQTLSFLSGADCAPDMRHDCRLITANIEPCFQQGVAAFNLICSAWIFLNPAVKDVDQYWALEEF